MDLLQKMQNGLKSACEKRFSQNGSSQFNREIAIPTKN
jgi:hypothetical protein